MKSVFSLKNTGCCGNLLKLFLLWDYCCKEGFDLIFPVNVPTKNILLERINIPNNLKLIDYISEQKILFNETCRKSSNQIDFQRKYLSYVSENYGFDIESMEYYYGNSDDINPKTSKEILCIDYNDGYEGYNRKLKSIKKFIPIKKFSDARFLEVDENYISLNLKSTISEEFDCETNFWLKTIEKILRNNPKKLLYLVSGNNELKNRILSSFHKNVEFDMVETITKNSLREGGTIIRGSELSVLKDVQNCYYTNFMSLHDIVKINPDIPSEKFFRYGKAEKFDLLVSFLKTNNLII